MAAGMKQVGQLYDSGEFFLPQLVMAGATMKHGMAVLEPLLNEAQQSGGKGVVVLGTVQGDLHDIGKNLVAMMLQGAGFEVVDLGVDVAPSRFVEAVGKPTRLRLLRALHAPHDHHAQHGPASSTCCTSAGSASESKS